MVGLLATVAAPFGALGVTSELNVFSLSASSKDLFSLVSASVWQQAGTLCGTSGRHPHQLLGNLHVILIITGSSAREPFQEVDIQRHVSGRFEETCSTALMWRLLLVREAPTNRQLLIGEDRCEDCESLRGRRQFDTWRQWTDRKSVV